MAIANRVEVVLLVQLDILNHPLARDRTAPNRISFMAVCPKQLDGLSVNGKHSALPLNLPEPNAAGTSVAQFPSLIKQINDCRVKIRLLRRPKLRVVQLNTREWMIRETTCNSIDRGFSGGNFLACAVHQVHFQLVSTRTLNISLDLERSLFVVCAEYRLRAEVFDAGFWRAQQCNVAEDAAEPEHILVFEVAAVRPSVNLNRDLVTAGFHEWRQIKLRRRLGILAIANLLAVDPKVVATVNATESNDRSSSFPTSRQLERCAVRPDRIVVLINKRWVRRMRIPHIGVDRLTIPLHLPTRRNLNGLPLGVVKIGSVEVNRTICRAPTPVKLPIAVQ